MNCTNYTYSRAKNYKLLIDYYKRFEKQIDNIVLNYKQIDKYYNKLTDMNT